MQVAFPVTEEMCPQISFPRRLCDSRKSEQQGFTWGMGACEHWLPRGQSCVPGERGSPQHAGEMGTRRLGSVRRARTGAGPGGLPSSAGTSGSVA